MGLLDVIALVVTALGLATLWAIQLFVVPRFLSMYADFGNDVALSPAIAMIARPMLVSVVSLVVLGLGAMGLALRLTGRATVGGLGLGAAALLVWLAVPGLVIAMYQPIFALSSAIGP